MLINLRNLPNVFCLILLIGLILHTNAKAVSALEIDPNNPQQIAPSSSVTIGVIGECPPYTWTATGGNDLKLGSSFTSNPSVTFNAESSACGNSSITIKDSCDNKVSTEVRSTAGNYDYLLLETCGVLDGWHQTTEEVDGFTYVVDYFNCNDPANDSGNMCATHPCLDCGPYYCAEGSQKWGWGCVGETLAVAPEDTQLGKSEPGLICPQDKRGNPVSVYNGNNYEEEQDVHFSSPHRMQLQFRRFYNSQSDEAGILGYGWSHSYNLRLSPACLTINDECHLKITDETGRGVYFKESVADRWDGAFGELTHVIFDQGGYTWYRQNGGQYRFSAGGLLGGIDDAIGNRLTLTHDANDRLQSVSDDSSGRILSFNYNVDDRLDYISGPVTPAVSDGRWVSYSYDSNGNLSTVAYADGSGFDYKYTDSYDAHNLTEKRNMMGHFLSTWTYDGMDRVRENTTRDGRGVSIDYQSDKSVSVTDDYGTVSEYEIGIIQGARRIVGINQSDGCATCGDLPARLEYDNALRVAEIEYANGLITRFENFDSRGNPQTIRTAVGTTDERMVYLTYLPGLNAILSRTEPSVLDRGSKITIWDYDNDGNGVPNENPGTLPQRKIEQGFTRDEFGVIPFEDITSFTYNSKGQVLTIDGPLPGSHDTITFSYDSITWNLLSITYPESGTVHFSDHSTTGRAGRVLDLNGNAVTYSYDGRERLNTITSVIDGSVTDYDYNTAGELSKITHANGAAFDFVYDSTFGRLIKTVDLLGNYLQYGYDDQGNRTELSYYDALDTRLYWKRFDYQNPDRPGKLWKEINPDDTFSEFLYDTGGNIISFEDAAGKITAYDYDVLNRISSLTQPGNVITSYGYDSHNNLNSVTDANTHATTYTFDDLGMALTRQSPDTGVTSYSYDSSNNLLYKREANGSIFTYLYDDASRLTGILFPEADDDVTFTYDEGSNGKGHLTGMSDASGTYVYSYDAKGDLISMDATIEGVDYTTVYSYDAAGILSGITFPDGRTLTYDSDITGRITKVQTTKDNTTITLADNIGYLPFGPVKSLTLGNGMTISRSYDDQYRLSAITAGTALNRSYETDSVGNVKSITDNQDATRNQVFSYDDLYRLTDATGVHGTINYTYDDLGNRLSQTLNSHTDTYIYEDGNNRLAQITGTDPVAFTYDASGNLIATDKTIQGPGGGKVAAYTYNGIGQRIKKLTDGITTIFHYDISGNLTGESSPSGDFAAVYVYLNGIRLAAIVKEGTEDKIYYYINDHLGTPQKIVNDSGAVVWAMDYLPFGETNVNIETLVNNFRFAGQYYDKETGLHYNWHRYFNPKTGRYLTPDPIGLAGGLNLYAYVSNDPINLIDPMGLIRWGTVGKGALATFGGGVAVVGGALVSTTGVGAIGGVPAVLVGSAGVGWGVSQIVAGFLDNEIPFMGTKEAIIKGTTEPGLLQDELLGANALGDMLLTGRTAPTDIGKINDALQSGYSIYESGSKIMDGNSGSSSCP